MKKYVIITSQDKTKSKISISWRTLKHNTSAIFFRLRCYVIIFVSLILMFSFAGCGNNLSANTPNTGNIKDNIDENDEIFISQGSLNNIVDFEKEFCVGYIGNDEILINDYESNTLQKVNIISGKREDIISLIDDNNRMMCSWRYKDGWFVWSEDAEKNLVIGESIGANWKIKAVNIEDKKIIEIDGEKNDLPKDRDFFATPISFSVDNSGVVFKGYYGEHNNIYERIVFYNFKDNKKQTVDEIIYNQKEKIDTPFISANKIYWGKYTRENDYMLGNVFVFDISSNSKSEIEKEMLFEPIANEKYIVALEKEKNNTINGQFVIMDQEGNEIKVISNEIYDDIKSRPSELVEPRLSENYLVWRNLKETQLDIYDIENDILHNIVAPASGRFVVAINLFDNNFLQWVEMLDSGEKDYKYMILKSVDK